MFFLAYRTLPSNLWYTKKKKKIMMYGDSISAGLYNGQPSNLFDNFILDEFYKLSINQFYNLFQYLKLHNILELNSDTLFRVIDKSNTLKNNLTEKDTINTNSDFLSIII